MFEPKVDGFRALADVNGHHWMCGLAVPMLAL
jgi:hypothetical protein